jgi:uncharacterized protein YhbP (UPF0306 family)
MGDSAQAELRACIAEYLRTHHTMTVATVAPAGGTPHAAHVFYAVDHDLGLTFLSQTSSIHGQHIGEAAPVAVTVSEDYEQWREIQGVQLWGTARLLTRTAEARALAHYIRRFPFVRELLKGPEMALRARQLGVYRVEPQKVAFTDNTSGVFGRQTLELSDP